MLNKNHKNVFKLALIPAAFAMFAGCADRDTIDPQAQAIASVSASLSTIAQANTITVAKGYLGSCTVTDASSLQAFEVGGGKYSFTTKPSGVITASGCINSVTGSTLPPLKTPAGKTVISPITNLIAEGATEAQVKAFVGDTTVDPYADPIATAATSTNLLKASAKIAALVEAATVITGTNASIAATAIANAVKTSKTTDADLANATGIDPAMASAISATVAALPTSGTEAAKQLEATVSVAKKVAAEVKDDKTKLAVVATSISTTTAAAEAASNPAVATAIVTKTATEIAAIVAAKVTEIVTAINSGLTSPFVSATLAAQTKADVQTQIDTITGNTGGATGATGATNN